MNSKKYVGFLDILGFSDLVTNNSEEKLIQIYEELLAPIVEAGLSLPEPPRPSNFKINSLVISDSIVLWTDDSTEESFFKIITVMGMILFAGIATGIPLRGAITAGNLTRLSNKYESNTNNVTETVLGKGLVDAYLLEKTQQWSGCIISKSALEEFKSKCDWYEASLNNYIDNGIIKKYAVPLKETTKEEYVLDWTFFDKEWGKLSEVTIRESFNKWNKTLNLSAEEKRDNTVTFFKQMKLSQAVVS